MASGLPRVINAGDFDSRKRFGDCRITPVRRVQRWELELFTESGGVAYINGCSHPIDKGEILLARPGDSRRSATHFRSKYIHFDAVNSDVTGLISAIPAYITLDCRERTERLFGEIYTHALSGGEYSGLMCGALLVELLCAIKELSDGNGLAQDECIARAVRFFDTHYAEKLNMPEAAVRCNLSISNFYNKFSAAVGVTPNEYLVRVRLSAAKKLLVSCDAPIDSVAQSCGFSSQSYFTSCFRQAVGVTPHKYRIAFSYPVR